MEDSSSNRINLSPESLERILTLKRGDKIVSRKDLELDEELYDSEGNYTDIHPNEVYLVIGVSLKMPENTVDTRYLKNLGKNHKGYPVLQTDFPQIIDGEKLFDVYVMVVGKGVNSATFYNIDRFQI